VVNGWDGFHMKERLRSHIGEVGGLHYNAMKKCGDLLNRKQHINCGADGDGSLHHRRLHHRISLSV